MTTVSLRQSRIKVIILGLFLVDIVWLYVSSITFFKVLIVLLYLPKVGLSSRFPAKWLMLQIIMMISYTLHFDTTWQVEASAETKGGMSQFRLGKSFDKENFYWIIQNDEREYIQRNISHFWIFIFCC